MKLAIKSTNVVCVLNGSTPARVWYGVTEKGVKCQVLVSSIDVDLGEDCSEFDTALLQTPPPAATGFPCPEGA